MIAHSGSISCIFFFFPEWLTNECKCRQKPSSETNSQRLLLDKAVVRKKRVEEIDDVLTKTIYFVSKVGFPI